MNNYLLITIELKVCTIFALSQLFSKGNTGLECGSCAATNAAFDGPKSWIWLTPIFRTRLAEKPEEGEEHRQFSL